MAEHRATIEWRASASAADLVKGRYSREHVWTFDGGARVAASAAPSIVPAPWSSPAGVDPEEAYVAAIASCHMLTFVHLASKQGFAAASYRDAAVGVMAKTARGTAWVSKVTLSPEIAWIDRVPTARELAALHHAAHAECFIANSITTEVVVASATS